MNLNIVVNGVKTNDIQIKLLEVLDNIYLTKARFVIDEKEYYDIVRCEIEKSKNFGLSEESYIEFIALAIKDQLTIRVKEIIDDPTILFKRLNNYINEKIVKDIDYEKTLQFFNELNDFFDLYNFIPEPKWLENLITKNETIKQMLDIIFQKHYVELLDQKKLNIFSNHLLNLFISMYSNIKNMEHKESIDAYLSNDVMLYLNDIGKTPLLTKDEEIKLAKKMKQGDKEAKELFIQSNLRLVVSIARRYVGGKLSFLDLIQEGNIGLIKAADSYDVEKGYRFSTFATPCINRAILEAFADEKHLSSNMIQKIKVYKNTVDSLSERLGRKPSFREIADEMKISVLKVIQLYQMQLNAVSLNALVDGTEKELEEFISNDSELMERHVDAEFLKQNINDLLQNCDFSDRERDILQCRFGFDKKGVMTLKALGKRYNLTQQMIRKIEEDALWKIRMVENIENYAFFLDDYSCALRNMKVLKKIYSSKKGRKNNHQ